VISYDDRVTTSPVRPVVLRDGVGIEDPLQVVLSFLKSLGRFDVSDPSQPASSGAARSSVPCRISRPVPRCPDR